MITTRSDEPATRPESALVKVVFAGFEVAARHEDIGAHGDHLRATSRLGLGHDPGSDVVGEREDRDSRFADGETGRGDHRAGKSPLEALPRSRAVRPRHAAARHELRAPT